MLPKERSKMSEHRKRHVYGAQFKAKVGLEAVRGAKTLNELGQHTACIRW